MDRCLHDFILDQCGICSPRPNAIDMHVPNKYNYSNKIDREQKQNVLDQLCDATNQMRVMLGVGSSIPSEVFVVMSRRYGFAYESMAATARKVCALASVPYDADCDSLDTDSGGGGTVTTVGLERMLTAAQKIDA